MTASPERLWQIVADVLSWPQHLETFTAITPSAASPTTANETTIALGDVYAVRQPGLLAAEYTVTQCTPGTSFTWVARLPGVRTSASHTVEPVGDGATLVLRLDWSGPLSFPVRVALSRRAERMMTIEARSLAQLAESTPTA